MRKFVNANANEINYVKALSRPSTIEAYSNWNELSETEHLLLERFVKPNSKIIDLGCGTGRVVKTIKPKTTNYIGIDCSIEMIDTAKKLNPEYKFICDDILNFTNISDTFDIVLLMNNVVDMLNPYERRESLFKFCKDCLNPNGILVYSSHLLSHNLNSGYYPEDYYGAIVYTYRATFSQLCSEIEDLGFAISIAARDYRAEKADWIYLAVTIKDTM